MEFATGYDLDLFKEYYKSLNDLHEYYKSIGSSDTTFFELGEDERGHIQRDSSHLIVWKQGDMIVGHAIWHETSTDEMIPGDPRDDTDRKILHHLCNGRRENLVELHEVWLQTVHRGKGYGKMFFEYFEQHVMNRGFDGIIYYSDHPTAVRICKARGYRQGYDERTRWYTLVLIFDEP